MGQEREREERERERERERVQKQRFKDTFHDKSDRRHFLKVEIKGKICCFALYF